MEWKNSPAVGRRCRVVIALSFMIIPAAVAFSVISKKQAERKPATLLNRDSLVHILPLGDSITQGDRNHRSYRYNLWIKLIDAGISFDFVGSLASNYRGNPEWPQYKGRSFDPDHEGHWGWRADQILYGTSGEKRGRLSIWLDTYTPDIVLMHLGTNDIAHFQDLDETANELKQIIESLRADNPNVIILLSTLIPIHNEYLNKHIKKFNAKIKALGKKMNTSISPIIVVDQYSEFDIRLDSYDGIHPNKQGEEKMAETWFQSVQDIFQ